MTNRHCHADMIIAKAENMDLVVFSKFIDNKWMESNIDYTDSFSFLKEFKYFLCLPKHKEAVLNILNGGESQINYGELWDTCNCSNPIKWSKVWWYMNEDCESRIKPRKEKRWIAVRNKDLYVEEFAFESIDSEKSACIPEFWSYHEIEVEV